MKFVSILVLLASAVPLPAQTGGREIAGSWPNCSVAFIGQNATASDPTMSSIIGRVGGLASGERFGIAIDGAAAGLHIIDIIGEKNAVLASLTASDLAGRTSSGGPRLMTNGIVIAGRYARAVYDVPLRGGSNVRLIIKALAAGTPTDTGTAHPLFVTYALSGSSSSRLSLRLALPVDGTLEATPAGFIVTARSGRAAMAGALVCRPQHVAAVGNILSVTGRQNVLEGPDRETAMLWMQVVGVGDGTGVGTREAALAAVGAAENETGGPSVVIVSATGSASVNPRDTVSMTLVCVNVGNQSASDVMVNNPLPQGTSYLDNSASGDRMRVEYEHGDGADGAVRAVRWMMTGELKPGEDRIARFKAIVQ